MGYCASTRRYALQVGECQLTATASAFVISTVTGGATMPLLPLYCLLPMLQMWQLLMFLL
ncbi:unnamed protein product, partial [Ceratitis capitata]